VSLGFLETRLRSVASEARPLKRLIQQELETPMARLIVKGELRDGDTASVDVKDGAIVVIPTVTGSQTPSSTQ